MTHHEVFQSKTSVIFLSLIFNNTHHMSVKFLPQNTSIRIIRTISNHKYDSTLLFNNDLFRCLDNRPQNMTMTSLIPPNFIHPHVDDQNI